MSTAPLPELGGAFSTLNVAGAAEDSDDEYVYVSRLAEQIASTMLDEEEEEEEYMRHYRLNPKCRASTAFVPGLMEQANSGISEMTHGWSTHSVSHRTESSSENGITEWCHFYSPITEHGTAKILPSYRSFQLEDAHAARCHWSSLNTDWKQSYGGEAWHIRSHLRPSPVSSDLGKLEPKTSIGTGVFLPKVVNTSCQNRRRASLSHSKSYAPRNKW
ncbi:hypothetical protein KP509_14G078900 [Ceratopteris richardii]|uniref:Uncharacterized protein n=1 Tax=Ceratopteris richardii TaxID=49495 RepID=A0A8T2TDD9_CERRI|nr:hypothetical protein KP509_14G078900 [Ceratopteris richardii]